MSESSVTSRDAEGLWEDQALPSRKLRSVGTDIAIVLVAVGLLLSTCLAMSQEASASVSAQNFNAGYIISDSKFYDSNAMTAAEVQTFLNQQVPTCHPEYDSAPSTIVCLKNYKTVTSTKTKDSYCLGYSGNQTQTAAQIIDGVARSCGVSQEVLIVLLQKENGLVTHTWPSPWRYKTAMGFGCPDTAACDSQYYGFFNQVYNAARQYKLYKANPSSYQYRVGTNSIYWNPKASCGSSTVVIKNQATAGLYNYTPYRPNQAALNAGYGEGDSCSSYGNRNFFLYYGNWFGDPMAEAGPILSNLTLVNLRNGRYYINSALAYTSSLDVPGASKTNGTKIQLYSGNQSVAQQFDFYRQADGSYEIVNANSGMALDVPGASTTAGTVIRQYIRNGSKAQHWFIRQASGGAYYLQSTLGNLALSLNNSSSANATALNIDTPSGSSAQQFDLASVASLPENVPTQITTALNKDLVVDIAGASTSNGAAIRLYTKNGTAAQRFQFSQIANGVYEIMNVNSRKMVEIPGGATANGTALQQYQSNATQAQRWLLRDAGNGKLSFYNLNSGKFIEISSGIAASSKALTIYTGNGSSAQQWAVEKSAVQPTSSPPQPSSSSPSQQRDVIADGVYSIATSNKSSAVVEIAGGNQQNGVRTSLYQTNGSKAQQWRIVNQGQGYVSIQNINSNKMLDVVGAQIYQGAVVDQYDANGSKAQLWKVTINSDGTMTIKSAVNESYVLDAHAGQTSNGTLVALYASNGTKAQQWILVKTDR